MVKQRASNLRYHTFIKLSEADSKLLFAISCSFWCRFDSVSENSIPSLWLKEGSATVSFSPEYDFNIKKGEKWNCQNPFKEDNVKIAHI